MNKTKKEFKQVYQYGMEEHNSFGDQIFIVIVDDEERHFHFIEGEHVNIEQFVNDLRNEVNER